MEHEHEHDEPSEEKSFDSEADGSEEEYEGVDGEDIFADERDEL